MKIRDGFVSNSSSSSFIIGFSQVPDAEYLKKLLYDDKDSYMGVYQDAPFSTDTLVSMIMAELEGKTPINDMKGIVEAIGDDASDWDTHPDYGYWNVQKEDRLKKGTPEYEAAWEKHNQETIESALEMAKSIHDPDLVFYSLSFADEDGSVGCELEHGSTWDRLPHLRFSHH